MQRSTSRDVCSFSGDQERHSATTHYIHMPITSITLPARARASAGAMQSGPWVIFTISATLDALPSVFMPELAPRSEMKDAPTPMAPRNEMEMVRLPLGSTGFCHSTPED